MNSHWSGRWRRSAVDDFRVTRPESAQQVLQACDHLSNVLGVGRTVGADGPSGLVHDKHSLLAEVDARDPLSQPVLGLRTGAGSGLVFTDEEDGGEARLGGRRDLSGDLLVGLVVSLSVVVGIVYPG